MNIKMLETRLGTVDGFTVREYVKGDQYEVGADLGAAFVGEGCAEEIKAKPAAPAPAEKPAAKPAHKGK